MDFDGPVCAVFGSTSDDEVADALRVALVDHGVTYPDTIAEASDPFEVLRFASGVDTAVANRIEQRFRECESRAVRKAPATPGAEDLLRRAAGDAQLVTIVSNNSTTAVRQYLELRELEPLVHGISARDDAVVEHLKPSPFLLRRAMLATETHPGECVMIGDSATDIDAARAAGTKVIAFANKPGKRERFNLLGVDGVVTSMTDL
ncbi:HAD family hydrolase [Amycolatopsis sp. NPDC003731]